MPQNLVKRIMLLLVLIIGMSIIKQPGEGSKAYAVYDSMTEFAQRATDTGNASFLDSLGTLVTVLYDCIAHKVVYWPGDLNNTCIPDVIGKDGVKCEGKDYVGTWRNVLAAAQLVAIVIVAIITVVASLGIGLLLIGPAILLFASTCVGAYIVAPHEYVSIKKGRWDCKSKGDLGYVNANPSPVTPTDVPFFYTCKNDDPKNLTYGYMGGGPLCTGKGKEYAVENIPNLDANIAPGSIIIRDMGLMYKLRKRKTACPNDLDSYDGNNEAMTIITKKQIANAERIETKGNNRTVGAFYRLNNGKVQLCAVTLSTFMPIILGCTSVAPPRENFEVDPETKKFLADNRCSYFLSGREDLRSAGEYILTTTASNQTGLFLTGDMHITSTIVGCLRDLLVQVFINPSNSGNNSFLGIIQSGMRNIVIATLLLYLTLLGMKIITSPNPPQKSEVMLYILKFALVTYFALGNAWYAKDATKQDGLGLYQGMLDTMDKVAGIFLNASDRYDPVKPCQYGNGDKNILAGGSMAGFNGIKPTNMPGGSNGVVQFTAWDLLDCKISNYLNLGMCSYNLSGMAALWFMPLSFLSGGTTLLFGLCSLVYILMLATVVFRFVHIVILAMFLTTILVLLAPIMISFALFEYTKNTFQSWMKMLIGYTLYPGMLFAFIALMLSTFDSMFYGFAPKDIDTYRQPCSAGYCLDLTALCKGQQSMYCTIMSDVTPKNAFPTNAACEVSTGATMDKISETKDLFLGIKVKSMKGVFGASFYMPMLKLMMFAVLFYFFTNAVIQFMESLFEVVGLSGIAGGDISKQAGQAAKAALLGPAGAALSLAKMAMSKKKESGSDDQKNR
mgnify:CR=1 FL=1